MAEPSVSSENLAIRDGLRAVVAALLGAELTAALALPWADLAGLPIATMLQLPVAALLCAFFEAGRVLVGNRAALRRNLSRRGVVASFGAVVFAALIWLSNVVLIVQPRSRRMLAAYGASACVAAIATVWTWRAWRRREFCDVFGVSLRTLLAGAVLIDTVILAVYDALALAQGYRYWRFHVLMLSLTLLCSCLFFYLRMRSTQLRGWAALALCATGLVAIVAGRSGSIPESLDAMLRTRTSHQRALLLARDFLDRDGDGFASELGGGDCDDSDPNAYPLSTHGQDCLGWLPGQRLVPAPHSVDAGPNRGPKIIVLLTIDTFRCGFGQSEVPELLNVCPQLTQLSRQGQLRLRAYTTYPATEKALSSLYALPRPGAPNDLLSDWFGRAGYETHAIAAPTEQFHHLESFQHVNNDVDTDGTACVAETVTDRVLEAVEHSDLRQPLFVWAHYLDPHEPYVHRPGSVFATAPNVDRYVAELRRTDAAIGRLARRLAALPNAGEVFLLLSADHGENLGEKGYRHHGHAVNDPGVRIPILTWSPSAKWTHAKQRELPSSIAEVGPFLTAVAKDDVFKTSGTAYFKTDVWSGYLFGVYSGGWKVTHHQGFGWTELYNLADDPFEQHNVAAQEPKQLKVMLQLLAAHIAADPALSTH